MADDERIDAYAAAFFEVAKAEDVIERVEDELFQMARLLESNDTLRSTLTDEAIPVDQRQGIIEDLLQGRSSVVTAALVSFVIGIGRGRHLPAIIDKLVAKSADARGQAVAQVRSVVPLDEDQRQRLAAALSQSTGGNVTVKVIVDPDLLGGLVVQIGDTVIDGSVRTRLNQLRETL